MLVALTATSPEFEKATEVPVPDGRVAGSEYLVPNPEDQV
jgi:hypothetical protein